ncbi:Uncharacterised protein [Bordetella pertussis]|nr:Uncharacterised protein [Bordetella pertussis]CFP64981.1 Uncharacterised protein [Bordetella pertussis]CFW40471.1 Uncharacterised protein [Bordetella pertussis]CPI67809.1 Uncharacterised protein [Bordetella pertussis]CPJ85304.1 Uncharacterised protein [Bordetella pertussis]
MVAEAGEWMSPSGSMKWFMPPTPITGSWMQAATQEPSTVDSMTSSPFVT